MAGGKNKKTVVAEGGGKGGLPSFSKIAGDVVREVVDVYRKESTEKTLVLDLFIACTLMSGGLQFLYFLCGGNFPLNGLFAALLTNTAIGCGALSLRLQTSAPSLFPHVTPAKALFDFLLVVLVAALAGYTFLG